MLCRHPGEWNVHIVFDGVQAAAVSQVWWYLRRCHRTHKTQGGRDTHSLRYVGQFSITTNKTQLRSGSPILTAWLTYPPSVSYWPRYFFLFLEYGKKCAPAKYPPPFSLWPVVKQIVKTDFMKLKLSEFIEFEYKWMLIMSWTKTMSMDKNMHFFYLVLLLTYLFLLIHFWTWSFYTNVRLCIANRWVHCGEI